ncbi:glycosyltransferase [Winogradskyella sp.]|uniref:glycosyltransferase n=1 Tax=Winogradskyella sp. TaxID=1883156 RepID=UPI003513DD2B
MKVIHYIGSLGFGGIERLVYDLVGQQNLDRTTKPAIGVGKLKGEFKSQFESLNVQLLDFDLNSGFDLSPIKILNITKHFKSFDVLHLHGFHLSIVIAALLSKKKIVYTEHGNFGFGRKIKISDRLSFLLRKVFFKYTKVTICCNSNFTKTYVERHFYRGRRLHLVYNGCNLNYTIDKTLKEDLETKYRGKFVIGTSSRLAGFKKVNRLISVFSEYIKINTEAVLVIVGDGIERQKLEKQVSDLKLVNNVVFEGFQKEVATYQSIFDVCVFPSKNEPFGLVAVECYSKEKPVLVFRDGGGITEIISKIEPNDICKDEKAMINRLDYYYKNEFQWSVRHSKQIECFDLKRMERDYYRQYSI